MSEMERDELMSTSPGDEPTIAWQPPADDTMAGLVRQTTTPVLTARPRSRLRWAVAVLVSVLVVGVTAAATVLVTGQSAPSALVGYAPSDSVIYAEARLDLPGDQRQKLGEFLSKFPGFDDQSIFDQKLDEALDQIIGKGSQGKQDWSTKIKPWFDGQVAVGLGVPSGQASASGASVPQAKVPCVVAVKVREGAAAIAWLKSALGDAHVEVQTYNGTELLLVGESGSGAVAIADGKAMVIGGVESVKKALDSHGNGTFGQTEAYKGASTAFSGDHLGFGVADTAHYFDLLASLPRGTIGAAPSLSPALKAMLPAWVGVSARAESDAIAFDFASPKVDAVDVGDNRASDILGHLPASTIVAAEGHDLGATLKKALDTYRQTPGLEGPMRQFDSALGLLGGFDSVFGWMRDGALVVTRNGSSVDGGIVLTPTDAAAAQRLLTALRSFVVLGGGQAGFKITDEDHNGVKITTIDFGDLRDLMNAAGSGSALTPGLPIDGRLRISYAANDQIVVVGLGDTFVKSVLDTQAGSSLATDSRFKAAADRAGSSNKGVTYVDIGGIRDLAETLIPDSSMKAEYEREYKPYLAPLEAFVVNNREDGSLNRVTEWLVVGK